MSGLPSDTIYQEPESRFVGEILDKALQSKGLPPQVSNALSSEIAQSLKSAQKQVPPWVLWLLLFFGGPFLITAYNQAQVIWSLPEQVSSIQETVNHQQTQLDRIEDLLSPTSRPK